MPREWHISKEADKALRIEQPSRLVDERDATALNLVQSRERSLLVIGRAVQKHLATSIELGAQPTVGVKDEGLSSGITSDP
jgi:hypothetical protein